MSSFVEVLYAYIRALSSIFIQVQTFCQQISVNFVLIFIPKLSSLVDPYHVSELNSLRSRLQIENTLPYCKNGFPHICFTTEFLHLQPLSLIPNSLSLENS